MANNLSQFYSVSQRFLRTIFKVILFKKKSYEYIAQHHFYTTLQNSTTLSTQFSRKKNLTTNTYTKLHTYTQRTQLHNSTQSLQNATKPFICFEINNKSTLQHLQHFKQLYTTLHNSTQLYKTLHKQMQNFTILYTTVTKLNKKRYILQKATRTHNFTKNSKNYTQLYTTLHNSTQLYTTLHNNTTFYNTMRNSTNFYKTSQVYKTNTQRSKLYTTLHNYANI